MAYTIVCTNEVITEFFLRKILDKFKNPNWETDTKIKFKEGYVDIKVNEPASTTALSITGQKIIDFITPFQKQQEKAEKEKITEEKAKKTIFKNMFTDLQSYNGLEQNNKIFYDLNKQFKQVGIKEINFGGTLTAQQISRKAPMLFCGTLSDPISKQCESGFIQRLKTLLHGIYKTHATTEENFPGVSTTRTLTPIPDETGIDIKIKNILVGKYWKLRNIIELYMNPFMFNTIPPIGTKISPVFDHLLAALKKLNIVTANQEKFKKLFFVHNFLKKTKDKIKTVENNLKNTTTNITNYEKSLGTSYISLNEQNNELSYLNSIIRNKGKGLYEEILKINTLPFVEKVELKITTIDVTFKETTIDIKDFYHHTGKTYGKRTMYLGNIKIQISPDGFIITNEILKQNNFSYPHPHASGFGGNPCFGNGGGHDKIYELLSSNKFVELIKILWFWIKTYRNAGAYVKADAWYNNVLSAGLPIWDDKKKRITINDPDRIKTAEQSTLTETDKYSDNIKKYKNIKLF